MEASNWVQLAFRILEFIWSALVMGIIGAMMQKDPGGNPAAENYAMFAAAFSIFFLFFLIPTSVKPEWSGSMWIVIALDILNTIWFLTSGIVLAARSQAANCASWTFLIHNSITQSVDDKQKQCRMGQAACAFLWFAFAAYLVSMIVSLVQAKQNFTPGFGAGGGGRASRQKPARPMMTQA